MKLAEILGIPDLVCKHIITEIQAELLAKSQQYPSYIFVETNFKRQSQPIMMLGAMQHLRRFRVSNELIELSLNQQLPAIQQIVIQHYADSKGKLKVWGKIQSYVYFYAEDLMIEFSPKGEFITASKEYFTSQATLKIK